MDETPSREQCLDKLRELIDGIPTAILTTAQSDGTLRGRPMATADVEPHGALWFFTDDDTSKASEIVLNPQVCVVYAAPERNRFVSISGKADLVRDPARLKQLWRPSLKAWFPEGLDDESLALLHVDVLTAEYWDGATSRLVQLLGRVAGFTPQGGAAEQGTLTLKTRIGPDTAT